jgi:hypothetical protein
LIGDLENLAGAAADREAPPLPVGALQFAVMIGGLSRYQPSGMLQSTKGWIKVWLTSWLRPDAA